MQDRFETHREVYQKTVDPVIESVHNELPEEQKPVLDAANTYLGQSEDRLSLMKTFRDTAQTQGHDPALLDYYIGQYEQSLDGCKDEIAHKNYVGMNGDLHQSNNYLSLFMNEAQHVSDADAQGKPYVAPEKPVFEVTQ